MPAALGPVGLLDGTECLLTSHGGGVNDAMQGTEVRASGLDRHVQLLGAGQVATDDLHLCSQLLQLVNPANLAPDLVVLGAAFKPAFPPVASRKVAALDEDQACLYGPRQVAR